MAASGSSATRHAPRTSGGRGTLPGPTAPAEPVYAHRGPRPRRPIVTGGVESFHDTRSMARMPTTCMDFICTMTARRRPVVRRRAQATDLGYGVRAEDAGAGGRALKPGGQSQETSANSSPCPARRHVPVPERDRVSCGTRTHEGRNYRPGRRGNPISGAGRDVSGKRRSTATAWRDAEAGAGWSHCAPVSGQRAGRQRAERSLRVGDVVVSERLMPGASSRYDHCSHNTQHVHHDVPADGADAAGIARRTGSSQIWTPTIRRAPVTCPVRPRIEDPQAPV